MSQFGRSYVTINGHLDKALWGIEDAYIVMLVSNGDQFIFESVILEITYGRVLSNER